MNKLISTSSQRSHSTDSIRGSFWYIEGHETFQSLLERGLEIRSHWAGERFWWKRVIYTRLNQRPPALFLEKNKQVNVSERHTICLTNIQSIWCAVDDPRIVEIAHADRTRMKYGRRLSLEFPTPQCAEIFRARLTSLVQAMGLMRSDNLGTHISGDGPDNATENDLLPRVTAQGYPGDGDYDRADA